MTEFIVYIGTFGPEHLKHEPKAIQGVHLHRHVVEAPTPYEAVRAVLQSNCPFVELGVQIEVFESDQSMKFISAMTPEWVNGNE